VRILGNFSKTKGSASKAVWESLVEYIWISALISKYFHEIALNYSESVCKYYITESHFNGKSTCLCLLDI
jgi:hypothetical protein